MVFVLTVSVGQGMVYVMKQTRRAASRLTFKTYPDQSRVVVESIPAIDFPKSLEKFPSVDFWLTSYMIQYPDGTVDDIRVDFENGLTFQERGALEEMLRSHTNLEGVEIGSELVEKLTAQMRGIKFQSRVTTSKLPARIFVVSHFRSSGSCFEIETQVTQTGTPVWKQTSTNKFQQSCQKF